MEVSRPYTKNLDTAIALITHLALTTSGWNTSRTIPSLVIELGIERSKIEDTFKELPGLFRESRNPSPRGELYYSLRARRALRTTEDDSQPPPQLRFDMLTALLEFVSRRADTEEAVSQFRENMDVTEQRFRDNMAAREQRFRENMDATERRFNENIDAAERRFRENVAGAEKQSQENIQQATRTAFITIGVAVLAAVATIIAAIISNK